MLKQFSTFNAKLLLRVDYKYIKQSFFSKNIFKVK